MSNDPTSPQNPSEPDAGPGFVDFTEELLKHADSAPKAEPTPPAGSTPAAPIEDFVAGPSRKIATGVENDDFEVRSVNKMSDAAWKKQKKVDVQRVLSIVLLGLAAVAVLVYVLIGGSPNIDTPPPAPAPGSTASGKTPPAPTTQNPVLPLDNATPSPQPQPTPVPPGGSPMHEQPMDDGD
jgi:hypothetical protein